MGDLRALGTIVTLAVGAVRCLGTLGTIVALALRAMRTVGMGLSVRTSGPGLRLVRLTGASIGSALGTIRPSGRVVILLRAWRGQSIDGVDSSSVGSVGWVGVPCDRNDSCDGDLACQNRGDDACECTHVFVAL